MEVTVWCCSATQGDPGPSAFAVSLQIPLQPGRGQLIRGYLGVRGKLEAEFAAMRRGLSIARRKGYRRACVYCHSEVVADLSTAWRWDQELREGWDHLEFYPYVVRNPKNGLAYKAKKGRKDTLAGWFELYTDGSAPQNSLGSGPIGAGAVLLSPWGQRLAEESWPLGTGTNNEAEYLALTYGLFLAQNWGVKKIRVFSDSQLIVRQIKGEYQVREPHLLPRYQMALAILEGFAAYQLKWIPRQENREADRLASMGLEKGNH
jgi:ribonuclease HI